MEGKTQEELLAMCKRIERMAEVEKANNKRYNAAKLAKDPTYFATKKAAYRAKVKAAKANEAKAEAEAKAVKPEQCTMEVQDIFKLLEMMGMNPVIVKG